MAKTNRRPVDRLERQQRIEHRRQQHNDDQGLISPRDWDVFTNNVFDNSYDEESLDQYDDYE
jgi:hypothetical protein